MTEQQRPEVQYASVGDKYVAYQVFGDGPIDLVFHAGFISHLDEQWDHRSIASFYTRLASFARVILFDRRGHGMSDPIDLDDITYDQWMDDLTAVMDAAGSEQAVLAGTTESGPLHILYAAAHPERTTALVLVNTTACWARHDDYPWGYPERIRRLVPGQVRDWLLGKSDELGLNSRPENAGGRAILNLRSARFALTPSLMFRFEEVALEMDVRHALSSVLAPTLVLHSVDQRFVRMAHGQYLADHIANAKFVELPGDQWLPWVGDQDVVLDEIEEFVTGVRPVREPDRVLATVLFTDVTSSTERAVELGDRKWRELVEAHDRIVRRELSRHRGKEVNTAGDGFLATFDGPARAVRCACAIVDAVREIGLDVRAGLHTGEIELSGTNVAGIAVHIGSRVSDLAWPGEVLVSRTVVDLVAGSGLSFTERGSHALKGVPGEWQLYAVDR